MREPETVDVLLDRLLQLPLGRGELLVRNDRRFQEPELIDGLLGEASVAVVDDPGLARKLARLAHRAAEHLDPGLHGRRQVTRCRVLALSHLANAHRCVDDLAEADRLLGRAFRLLRPEDEFPELARVFSILASLRREQRRLADAEAATRKAIAISRRSGDGAELARALCKEGHHHLEATLAPEQAEHPLREALALLDPEEDPWGGYCIRHELARCYVHTGRFEAARQLFKKSRHLYEVHHQSLTFRDWLEGRLAAHDGHFHQAEALLRRSWQSFRSWDWGAAMAALDVANLYAQYGRQPELREFAPEMTPTLFCRGLHREAVSALGHLLRAIRFESVGPETIRAVYLYVHRSRYYPEAQSPFG